MRPKEDRKRNIEHGMMNDARGQGVRNLKCLIFIAALAILRE